MIQRQSVVRVVIGLLATVVLVNAAPIVGAIEGTTETQETTTNTTTSERSTTLEKRTAELQQRQAALEKKKLERVKKEQELKEKRIKQCAAKADGINTALSKITENRRRIFDRLGEISDKVQSFVTNKQLTIENYSTLVATVNERRGAAEASVNQVDSVSTLNCNDTRTPKDQLQTFREKRKSSVDALKEYRSAIKQLILAVKASIPDHKGLEGRSQNDSQKPEATGDAQ